MGADWGPIFSGFIIAICLIIAIPFIADGEVADDNESIYTTEFLQESFK